MTNQNDKPAWSSPDCWPSPEQARATQRAVLRWLAGVPASTGATGDPAPVPFPVSTHQFAVCDCGAMKYDRFTGNWWQKTRGGSWVFVGSLWKRRQTSKILPLKRNSPNQGVNLLPKR